MGRGAQFELNTRCNEAIGQNLSELLIYADELPVSESWEAICKELGRAGLEDVRHLCLKESKSISRSECRKEMKDECIHKSIFLITAGRFREPFDTVTNKKINVSSKYGDGSTASTLCSTGN